MLGTDYKEIKADIWSGLMFLMEFLMEASVLGPLRCWNDVGEEVELEKMHVEEPCSIMLPVYSSWRKISFFVCSVSFILSEISTTGYCPSY